MRHLISMGVVITLVAASIPALAFENEFHGLYRIKAMVTDFQDSGLGTAYQPPLLSTTTLHRDYTLFEQRARLQYIAKASDDLRLVTHFEIDSTWGDAAFQNSRDLGGGLGADTVNLETKKVYLDFNIPSAPINMKVGIQGFTDAYKGIFIQDEANFDDYIGGVVATTNIGPTTITTAFLRTYDKDSVFSMASTGKQTVDIYVADAKFATCKSVTVGTSYYGAYNNSTIHKGQLTNTVGLNVAAKVGIVDFDAFGLYQFGNELYGATKQLEAYAAQIAARVAVGPMIIRGAGLYASGDNNTRSDKSRSFQNIFASAFGVAGGGTSLGVYYTAGMQLLMRSALAMDSDNALITSTNNNNRGLVAAFVGADVKITDKLNISSNIGHATIDRKNEAVVGSVAERNTNKNIGTEVNTSLNYALYSNLTATVQGAYVFLGAYPKMTVARKTGENVANPYLACLILNYSF